MPKTELIPSDLVIWQSDTAKSYYCDQCGRWVRSQHEGEDKPRIFCSGGIQPVHKLEWDDA